MDYQMGLYFLNFLTVVFSVNDNFYAVHLDKIPFEEAHESCKKDGGFLTNMLGKEEILRILKAISDKGDQSSNTFWIGLKKDKTRCVQDDLPLKGLHWTIDNDNTTNFEAKWKVKPELTCTNVLCGQLSVEYRDTVIDSWGLATSSCKQKYPFICKHDGQNDIKSCTEPQIPTTHDIIKKNKDPYTLQITCSGNTFTLTCSKSSQEWKLVGETQADISEICLECQKGYKKNMHGTCEDIDECQQSHMCKELCINTQGSYQCSCRDDIGNIHKENSKMCKRAVTMPSFPSPADHMEWATTSHSVERQHPTTKQASNSTAGNGVDIEGSNGSLSNILVPVIVALLILVVLIVLIAAMARCCHVRRAKKRAKRRAQASREAVALNGSDSVEKMNEKEAT